MYEKKISQPIKGLPDLRRTESQKRLVKLAPDEVLYLSSTLINRGELAELLVDLFAGQTVGWPESASIDARGHFGFVLDAHCRPSLSRYLAEPFYMPPPVLVVIDSSQTVDERIAECARPHWLYLSDQMASDSKRRIIERFLDRVVICSEVFSNLEPLIDAASEYPLSEAEISILNHALIYESAKESARALNLSARTVETYRYRVAKKLAVERFADVATVIRRAEADMAGMGLYEFKVFPGAKSQGR